MIWALMLACEGTPDTAILSDEEVGDIVSLRIEPAELVVYTSPGEPYEEQFTAYATLEDGTELPIDLVQWDSSNESAGLIDSEGGFASVDTNGGVTEITARTLTQMASVRVQVIYTEDITYGNVNPAMIDAFNAVESFNGNGPSIVYPGDGVRVPRNLEGLAFMWDDTNNHSGFRVRLRSEITDVSIYARDTDSISVGQDLWELISAANRDGRVSVVVQSGLWDGATLGSPRTGDAIELVVNRLDARGSVLYWAGADSGIMRIPFGSDTAELFWKGATGEQCVGCHIVSNQSNRMVVNHDGINGVFSSIDVYDESNPQQTVDPNDQNRVSFKTMTPDGDLFLASNFGQLSLWRVGDGKRVKTYNMGNRLYSHPDFHPDGDRIVAVQFKSMQGVNNEFQFTEGRIVVIPFDPSTQELGEPVVVVPYQGNTNCFYPAWSPTGEWIAYNRAQGAPYANRQAALWLVNEAGTTDIELATANQANNNQNSYARWGPLPDDNVLWLAFSSSRDYPPGGPAQNNIPNIWISAIDEDLAEQGQDPSSEAFWLPGQVRNSDNHLPVWWDK